MARVKAFQVDGIEMWFPSGDHRPAHFHARKPGHWTAKVWILEEDNGMIQLTRPPGATIRGSDRKAIIEGVVEHREELLREYDACQVD